MKKKRSLCGDWLLAVAGCSLLHRALAASSAAPHATAASGLSAGRSLHRAAHAPLSL